MQFGPALRSGGIFWVVVARIAVTADNGGMNEPNHEFVELLRRDRRYRVDAYALVFESLEFLQGELGGKPGAAGGAAEAGTDDESGQRPIRHVSGQQLCEGIRRYALRQYGGLAKCVLNEWGVRSTSDFGEIVYNLIGIGRMHKTDTDRREDFDNVFDFDEGLRDAFVPRAPEPRQERRP